MCYNCVPLPQWDSTCLANSPTEIHEKCSSTYESLNKNPFKGSVKYDVVGGHFNYGIEYAWLPKESSHNPDKDDVFRITQLREPTSRIRSFFQFKPIRTRDFKILGFERQLNFLEYLENFDELNNLLIRDKYGLKDSEGFVNTTVPVLRYCGQACVNQLHTGIIDGEEAYNIAEKNLKTNFHVVGTTENMELFIHSIGKKFSLLKGLQDWTDNESGSAHVQNESRKELLVEELNSEEGQKHIANSVAIMYEKRLYETAKRIVQKQNKQLSTC